MKTNLLSRRALARWTGRTLAALVAVTTVPFLSGCGNDDGDDVAGVSGSGGGDSSGMVVGFAQTGAESTWRTAETKSVQDAAEERGIELKFSDGQGKQENQIKAIRSFVAQGVDAILLAPLVKTGWEQPLQEAKRAGIPVILLDRGVDAGEDMYTTLIGSDFTEEGRMAAEFLKTAMPDGGNIVVLEGTPGSDPAIERKVGFDEVLGGDDKYKIIKEQTGNFERAKGKETMEAFLKSGDTINAVYAHNDDMALGAIQAIKEAGMKPGDDIIIVSIDAVKGAFDALMAKELNATVECNPLLGPLAFDALEKVKNGETVEKRIVMKDEIFTRDDVTQEIVDGRQY